MRALMGVDRICWVVVLVKLSREIEFKFARFRILARVKLSEGGERVLLF